MKNYEEKIEEKGFEYDDFKEEVRRAKTILDICLTVFAFLTFPIYLLDYMVFRVYATFSHLYTEDSFDLHGIYGILYRCLDIIVRNAIRKAFVNKYGMEWIRTISGLLQDYYVH